MFLQPGTESFNQQKRSLMKTPNPQENSTASQPETGADAAPPAEPIAIVGLSGLFPGAPDVATFWQNILGKKDFVTDPPPEAWPADRFYAPDSEENDRVYCKKGGFLGPLATFDALQNGVMPNALDGGEPDQWLALRLARTALADAGYSGPVPERQRTAVIIGKGTYLNRGNMNVIQHGRVIDQTLDILRKLHPEHSEAELAQIRAELKKELPPFNADVAPSLIPNIIAGRIANKLDLMGPTYTVDGACASSLIAVDIAVRDLLSGASDLALVGGAHVLTPVPVLMLFCQLSALSHQQKIRPFDKNADGTILGEGIGMVVLKRLADAQRDGNRIYALIRGVGIASDGHGLSVMAPRPEGEQLALRRAYEQAGVEPGTVGLIEAHGTGTPLGDATELASLAAILGPRRGKYPATAVGSVKSMIGHLMPAAGMAGLIKAALSLHHRILPPTLNVEEPAESLQQPDTPLYLNSEARPWIHSGQPAPRRAGVNAFGFGGINAHLVLEEAPTPAATGGERLRQRESELLLLAGQSQAELLAAVENLQALLHKQPETDLTDLAYSLSEAFPAQDESALRLAIVATSTDDLTVKLQRAAQRLAKPNCRQIKDARGVYFFAEPLAAQGKLAFLFPGEGSQYSGMLADLCMHFPEVRTHFDEMDAVYATHPRGFVPSDFIFPQPAFGQETDPAADGSLWGMENAVEAVLTANRAMTALLARLGIVPDVLVGHSTGEYSALIAAGMIDISGPERLAAFCMGMNQIHHHSAAQDVQPAALIAVAAPSEQVEPVTAEFAGKLFVAMDNCPHQTVLACPADLLEAVSEALAQEQLLFETLPFDRPYHTPLFDAYTGRFRRFFDEWIAQPPQADVYSCTTVGLMPTAPAEARKVAFDHWLEPVRFRQTVEQMYADGVRLFVEVGAGGNLTSFVGDTLRGRPHLALAANTKSRSGISQLNHLLALLTAQGLNPNLAFLFAGRSCQRIELDPAQTPARRPNTTVQLKTGWPGIELSEAAVARLRPQKQPPTDEPVTSESTPVPADSLPADSESMRKSMNNQPSGPIPSAPAQPSGAETHPANGHVNGQVYANGSNGHSAHPPVPYAPAGQQPAHSPAVAQVMLAHLQTMDRFLETQRAVMQAYLTGQAAAQAGAAQPLELPPVAAPQMLLPGAGNGVYSQHSNGQGGNGQGSGFGEAANGNGHVPAVTHQPPPAPAPAPMPAPLPAAMPAPTPAPAQAAPAPAPAPAPAAAPAANGSGPALDPAGIHALLLSLLSERTGYPTEMLDPSLDLEADLGIDSIKRVEILGSFQQETGIALSDHMEELSKRKTLQEIVDFLAGRVGS